MDTTIFTVDVLAQWLDSDVDFAVVLEKALKGISLSDGERHKYRLGAEDGYERLLEMNLVYFRSLEPKRRRNEIAGALRW